MDPAAHGRGATEPMLHALPLGHDTHCEAAESCVEFEYVPDGHSCGPMLPAGQNAPLGQGSGLTVATVGQ